LSSRLALVTGAASGLAAGVALALARAGYRIAFTYRPGGTPPDETVAAVRFAIGDDAGYCNGMVLGVNGGLVGPHE
jgi:hypothetical protein